MNAKAIRLPSYQKIIISLSLLFSLTALSLSYIAQYGWNLEPCRLCKLQRIPFFFIFVFSGSTFLPSLEKFSIRMLQVAFMTSAILASYHLLVINGVITDPCTIPSDIATLEDFQKILEAPLPCSKASAKLLGIPYPGYNAILTTLFLIFLRSNSRSAQSQVN